uniref:Uncharacterized protein n=1 Tax=Timema bartmani TaxID=61472 RepID=A0A7R9I2E3_9NEOP|nr:unnamed protein product [Timema bartmani]
MEEKCARLDVALSERFDSEQGVRQGYVMSPWFFIFMDKSQRDACEDGVGVQMYNVDTTTHKELTEPTQVRAVTARGHGVIKHSRVFEKGMYPYLRGEMVENHIGETTLSTPNRDLYLNLTVISGLVFCENSALDHAAIEAVYGFFLVAVAYVREHQNLEEPEIELVRRMLVVITYIRFLFVLNSTVAFDSFSYHQLQDAGRAEVDLCLLGPVGQSGPQQHEWSCLSTARANQSISSSLRCNIRVLHKFEAFIGLISILAFVVSRVDLQTALLRQTLALTSLPHPRRLVVGEGRGMSGGEERTGGKVKKKARSLELDGDRKLGGHTACHGATRAKSLGLPLEPREPSSTTVQRPPSSYISISIFSNSITSVFNVVTTSTRGHIAQGC